MADNLSELQAALRKPELNSLMYSGLFAIRMETHRILTDGRASRYPYPAKLSSRRTHLYLTTDISDNMMELKGTPQKGSADAVRQLDLLQQALYSSLQPEERLWPLSLPPKPVYDHDLDFLAHHSTRYWISNYNTYLIKKYGIKRQLIAGVRVNYSLDTGLVEKLYQQVYRQQYASLAEFKNQLYFKLAQFFYLHRWLFTYLYGASPTTTSVKHDLPEGVESPVRSLRSSDVGYTNRPSEQVPYDTLEHHVQRLTQMVDDGTFASFKEFFGPVRLRGDSHNLPTVIKQGIKFLEFRTFDLDPFALSGISEDTLNFLELFMLYGMTTTLPANISEALAEAKKLNNEVAIQNPLEEPQWLQERAQKLIGQLKQFVVDYNAPRKYQQALQFVQRRLEDPSLTIGGQVADKLADDSLLSFGLKIANDRYTDFLQFGHPLAEEDERFSPSAHHLVMAAIELGLRFSADQDLELSFGDHHENFPADVDLEFPHGARQYLMEKFPEIKDNFHADEIDSSVDDLE